MIEIAVKKRLHPGKVDCLKTLYQDRVFKKSHKLILERLGKSYHHANFEKLLGYCLEDKEFLLVYEYMENGCLANHLYGRPFGAEPLSWFRRIKILLGAAQGLAFLHKTMKVSSNKQFGTHNILLDQEFNSKLSYFGLEPAYKFPVFPSSYATLSDHHPNAPPETHCAPSDTKTSRSNRISIYDGGLSEENNGNIIDDSGSAKENSGDVPLGRHESTLDLKKFSFDQLDRATQNFKKENFLGQGDFGQVYRGWIHEKTYSPSTPKVGMVVAIKRLYPGKFNSYRLVWEWLAKYSHTNLVKLLGYCLEGEKFLLVYEFMENGSLSTHLFKNAEPLPWVTRVKILEGAARGLAFLHATIKESSNKQFGTHNILLDMEFNSKLSYVGLELADTFPGFTSSYPSAPPETLRGEYDMKSDVFMFGGVLLEVLTGLQKYTPDWEMSKENLAILPVSHYKFEPDKQYIWSMVDPRLVGNYPRKGAVLLLLLARSCLKDDPKDRPSMEEVLREVEGISCIKIDVNLART